MKFWGVRFTFRELYNSWIRLKSKTTMFICNCAISVISSMNQKVLITKYKNYKITILLLSHKTRPLLNNDLFKSEFFGYSSYKHPSEKGTIFSKSTFKSAKTQILKLAALWTPPEEWSKKSFGEGCLVWKGRYVNYQKSQL